MSSPKNGSASFGSLVILLVTAIAFPVVQDRQVSPSIAMLPLENLSGDPQQEYFADGLHDALLAGLGQIAGFERVIARDSVLRFKGTKDSPAAIARQLKVDTLFNGAVLRSGDRVRVTVRLVNPTTQALLWAQIYERDMRDVLALRNEIVSAIARASNVTLTRQDTIRLARARRVDPEAYDAFLQGEAQWYQLTRQGLDSALSYFTLALEKDPRLAQAHDGVSRVWSARKWQALVRPSDATPHERAAVLNALESDGTLAEAHFALAGIKTWYVPPPVSGGRPSERRGHVWPDSAETHLRRPERPAKPALVCSTAGCCRGVASHDRTTSQSGPRAGQTKVFSPRDFLTAT